MDSINSESDDEIQVIAWPEHLSRIELGLKETDEMISKVGKKISSRKEHIMNLAGRVPVGRETVSKLRKDSFSTFEEMISEAKSKSKESFSMFEEMTSKSKSLESVSEHSQDGESLQTSSMAKRIGGGLGDPSTTFAGGKRTVKTALAAAYHISDGNASKVCASDYTVKQPIPWRSSMSRIIKQVNECFPTPKFSPYYQRNGASHVSCRDCPGSRMPISMEDDVFRILQEHLLSDTHIANAADSTWKHWTPSSSEQSRRVSISSARPTKVDGQSSEDVARVPRNIHTDVVLPAVGYKSHEQKPSTNNSTQKLPERGQVPNKTKTNPMKQYMRTTEKMALTRSSATQEGLKKENTKKIQPKNDPAIHSSTLLPQTTLATIQSKVLERRVNSLETQLAALQGQLLSVREAAKEDAIIAKKKSDDLNLKHFKEVQGLQKANDSVLAQLQERINVLERNTTSPVKRKKDVKPVDDGKKNTGTPAKRKSSQKCNESDDSEGERRSQQKQVKKPKLSGGK